MSPSPRTCATHTSGNQSTFSAHAQRRLHCYIVKKDKALQLKKASKFCHLNAIADSVGWRKLWDLALDHGPSGIKSVKNLVRIISYPNHATNKCPKCEIAELDPLSLPAHIIDEHTNSESSWDALLNSLVSMDPTFFTHVLCLLIRLSRCFTYHNIAMLGFFLLF